MLNNVVSCFCIIFVHVSVRGGVIPHITQIAATNLQTGDKLNLYVQPGCPISAEAQMFTGITTNGTSMAVNGKEVESADIKTGLQQLCSWLQKFKDVCLVAHNGRRFDFPVLITALVKNNLKEQFMQCVMAFCDSMALFRKVFPNQCLKQESLVKSVLGVAYDAHNAMADVESLGRLIQHTLPQVKSITGFTFSPEAVHNNIMYNKQKSLNIRSLDMLMAKGVFKRPTAENIAGSGLHVSLQHLRTIYKRGGEDGLRDVFMEKNSEGQPRVTNQKRILDVVIPKLGEYLESEKVGGGEMPV
jgi:DNA polymerase III alpha subunit (gram-positive type)